MIDWLKYRIEGETAHIAIVGEICGFSHQAEEYLAKLAGVAKARVVINSHGGSTPDALKIYEFLAGIDCEVVIEHAASAAVIIAQAGKVRRIHAGAMPMLHGAIDFVAGNPVALRAAANNIESIQDRLARILTARTGQPENVCRRWISGPDEYFTADEFVALGLADEIIPAAAVKTAAIEAAPAEAAPTEQESLCLELLRAMGPLRVANRAAFFRELNVWASTVREL